MQKLHRSNPSGAPQQGDAPASPVPASPSGSKKAGATQVKATGETPPALGATYHHGHLRDALLAEAARVIEAEGVEQVSIRQLAKNLGVSPAAPFRHFADRKALFTAVAEQATERLAQAMQAAVAQTVGAPPWAQMLALGQAYLAWARTHRSHFLVVSDRRLIDYDASEAMQASNARIRQHMHALLEQSVAQGGVLKADAGVLVLMLRAMVYGLARMAADGQWAEWSAQPGGVAEGQNQALETLVQLLGAYDAQP